MRTFDYAPLYRSTVGFDRLFDMLDSGVRSDWPPYDIEKVDDDQYRISMAVAGFALGEIEITQEGTDLLVIGRKEGQQDERQLLHRGIATRSFRQLFNLADHVKVNSAQMENGMLLIDLVREVPEQLKPRRIAISQSNGGTQPAPKQIENETQAKAA